MIANIVVLLVVLGCAAYQYFKGTVVKAFAAMVAVICSSAIAFGYFETLARIFINKSAEGEASPIVPWAEPLSFVLLFVIVFVILQTILGQLTRHPVSLGKLPEMIGRPLCGMLTGWILSGLVLTAAAMSPIEAKYPYERFSGTSADTKHPNGVLLSADGFAAGWFSMLSGGSMSGSRSFASLHPDFVSQEFLNKQFAGKDVPIVTHSDSIEVPDSNACWPLGGEIENKPPLEPGQQLMAVRVGITDKAIKGGAGFTLSQLRLICKSQDGRGTSENVYPIGYLQAANQLQSKRLADTIKIESSDLEARRKWIDFVFAVPAGLVPAFVEFKDNCAVKIPAIVPTERAPIAVPFIQQSRLALDSAAVVAAESAKIYGVELMAGRKALSGLTLAAADPNGWKRVQDSNSLKPAEFRNKKIDSVRAALTTVKPAEGTGTPEKIIGMLRVPNGYKLLSLKCNAPATGAKVAGDRLPLLLEMSGVIHHPVGVAASAIIGDKQIYEFDYCSSPEAGLVVAADGSVSQTFPDSIWITEKAQKISEFYVLYLVKTGKNVIIMKVETQEPKTATAFKDYDGFAVR